MLGSGRIETFRKNRNADWRKTSGLLYKGEIASLSLIRGSSVGWIKIRQADWRKKWDSGLKYEAAFAKWCFWAIYMDPPLFLSLFLFLSLWDYVCKYAQIMMNIISLHQHIGFAHDGEDVTGYQGLLCPSNKPSCDRLPTLVHLVKAGCRRVFLVQNRPHLDNFQHLVNVFTLSPGS